MGPLEKWDEAAFDRSFDTNFKGPFFLIQTLLPVFNMVLTYQQTIHQAFRGVSDSLVGYQKNREFREHQEQLVIAAQDAARLSELRYQGGATSYLEVLTNETNAFNAELGLAQAQLNELVSLVEIYRNLGGGWEA